MRVVFVAIVALVTNAYADDVVVGGSPRAIGRAGTGTVGDDGGGALLVNPAAMARRDVWRVQLGTGVVDDSVRFRSHDLASPPAGNQAGPAIVPLVAVEGAIGAWVIGVAATTSSVTERALRPPSDLPATELGNAFDYRYAGIAGALRRDTIALGVARRIGDQLAVGVSVAGSRVGIAETRRIWAGFDGRDMLFDPRRDVEFALHAHDPFVASAVAGVLVAPSDTPLELGASVGWSDAVHAAGDAATAGTTDGPSSTSGTARLELRQPLALRAGARYLGERIVVEVGVDYWHLPAAARTATWLTDGVTVRDPSGVTATVDTLPSRISARSHAAIRAACDVHLIEGLLWATAGYAYSRGGTDPARLSPTFGDLGGHTFALGVEGTAGGATLTLGWSRTISTPHPIAAPDLALDNPFHAGDATTYSGTYDGSIDQVGIVLDVER